MPSREAGRVAVRIGELALFSGIGLGLLLAAQRIDGYLGIGPLRMHLHFAALSIDQVVLLAVAVQVLHLAASAAAIRRLGDTRWARSVGCAVGLAPAYLLVGWAINRQLLPGIFEAASVVGNATLIAAFALFAWWLAPRLDRWLLGPRKPHRWGVAILGMALLALNAAYLLARLGGSPNVIVILVDALRADHLGCYGYARSTSPHIDRLARDSVVFTQAISPSTFTKTSIASLFTGLDPHHHGVYRGNRRDTADRITSDVLGAEHETLAEALRDRGLLTVAWVENQQLRAFMGFDQGFTRFHDQPGTILSIHSELIPWLERYGRAAAFFAYVHYIDLHDPYRPRPPFDTMYGTYSDVYAGLDLRDYSNWGRVLGEIRRGERQLSEADLKQLEAYYDGVLTYIDARLGELFAALRESGIYDDSLIVLTSDHGDGFMEHGFISHSTIPYEELVRVPLIVKLPRSRGAGRRVHQQVRLVDVLPTVLDQLGSDAPPGIDGRSLEPLLEGSAIASPPPPAFIEIAGILAIRTPEWKYIRFDDGGRELYDLRNDPGERHELAASNPESLEVFEALASRALVERDGARAESVPLDAETIRKLRSLGYIE